MFTTKSKKQKRTLPNWENPVEALRDFPGSVAQAAKEESKNLVRDTWRQLLSLEQDVQKLSGDLTAGQSIDITQIEQSQVQEPTYNEAYPEFKGYQQPGIDYHREFAQIRETRIVKEDTKQLQVRIDQILVELKKLTSSSQELAVQFEEVTMEEVPQEAGTYHLTFFEWVFSAIRKARERIEESQTWLAMFKSKKKQKGYWNMFQKHGTTFGLSGERVVATQTG